MFMLCDLFFACCLGVTTTMLPVMCSKLFNVVAPLVSNRVHLLVCSSRFCSLLSLFQFSLPLREDDALSLQLYELRLETCIQNTRMNASSMAMPSQ